MSTNTMAGDCRTEAQKKADEAAAAGNWSGFESEELLTEDGALEILARSKRRTILGDVCNQPFRWREKVFRILRCEIADGEAEVEVAPQDDELIAELKRRVAADRFHYVAYCQCFGFACFPEDYPKYQD